MVVEAWAIDTRWLQLDGLWGSVVLHAKDLKNDGIMKPFELSQSPRQCNMQLYSRLAARRRRALAGFSRKGKVAVAGVAPLFPKEVMGYFSDEEVRQACGFFPIGFVACPGGVLHPAGCDHATTVQGGGKPRPVPPSHDGRCRLPMLPILLTAAFMGLPRSLCSYLQHLFEGSPRGATATVLRDVRRLYRDDERRGVIKTRERGGFDAQALKRALEDGFVSPMAEALETAALAAWDGAGREPGVYSHVNVFAGLGVSTIGFVLAALSRGFRRIRVWAIDEVAWRLKLQEVLLLRILPAGVTLDFKREMVTIDASNARAVISRAKAWAERAEGYASMHCSPSCARACGTNARGGPAACLARVLGGDRDVDLGLHLLELAEQAGFDAGTWECSIKGRLAGDGAAPRASRKRTEAPAPMALRSRRRRACAQY